MSSLDRLSKPAICRSFTRPNAGPYRRFTARLAPIGTYGSQEDMSMLAQKILVRIKQNRKRARCGSYLLGDNAGNVFVMAEESFSPKQVDESMDRYVGSYARGAGGVRWSINYPTIGDILDDLREHFRQMWGMKG